MHPTITFEIARQEGARRLEHAETIRARARILAARHSTDASRRPPDPRPLAAALIPFFVPGLAGTAVAR